MPLVDPPVHQARQSSTGEHADALATLVGRNPAFVRELAKVPRIAACDCRVMITGETGTGKELFAQAIHYLSPRADHPFVAVNCGSLPQELIQSDIFGHVRGAYTSAQNAREGLLAEAEGGTLYLDDVDCLPVTAQSTFLRVLQEGEYRLVGSNAVRRCNVRVIASSNRNLSQLCVRNEFRQDLYFRLNTVRLSLPPLRERTDDIAMLALHFLRGLPRWRGAVIELSPTALDKLLAHDWPGNVRELQHVLERATLMCDGPVLEADAIEIDDAATPTRDELESFAVGKARVVAQFERTYVEQLLGLSDGNVTRAARAARKNRRAFFALMKKHGIEAAAFRHGLDSTPGPTPEARR